MPELPEARTIARRLHEVAAGGAIAKIHLLRRDLLKTGSPKLLAALAGQAIEKVNTRAKYVIIHTSAARLVIQLGMSGQVRIMPQTPPAVPTHTHLIIQLADGRQIFYLNIRRIACGLHVLPPGEQDLGPLTLLGPEATDITAVEFIARLRHRKKAIKTALMHPSILAGVGNIYSDEALFRAGIRPTRLANEVSVEKLRRLHATVRQVLKEAIAAGGSSLKTSTPYKDADGHIGRFSIKHRVYGRAGEACVKCGGTLKRVILGGRSSVYCPRCQK